MRYEYDGPVNPKEHAYIERRELETCFKLLGLRRSVVVYGSRQSGKTSLLDHLQRLFEPPMVTIQPFRLDIHKYTDLDGASFFSEVAYDLGAFIKIPQDRLDRVAIKVTNAEEFRHFLISVFGVKRIIAVLVDDAEKTPHRHVVNFLQLVEKLLEAGDIGTQFVTCLCMGPSDTYFKQQFNEMKGLFEQVYLDDFNSAEVHGLVRQQFGRNAELAGRIHHWTNGHPYLTNKVLSFMDGKHENNATADEAKLLVEQAVNSIDAADLNLGYVQTTLENDAYRSALNELIVSGRGPTPDIGRALIEQGIIIENHDGVHVRNRIYETILTRALLAKDHQQGGPDLQNQRVAVASIHIDAFRCLQDTHLEALPIDCPWIFLTGENAFGKTCLLQALAISIMGDQGAESLVNEDTSIRLSLHIGEHRYPFAYPAGENRLPFQNVVGYGPSRLRFLSDKEEDFEHARNVHVFSLFKQKGVLLDLQRDWLKDELIRKLANQSEASAARIDFVLELIAKLLPHVDKVELDESQRISFTECGRKVPLSELSAGHRSIFAMIGDLLIRLYQLNPHVVNPADFRAIVLIDELENHLHPRWQLQFPGLLSETFPHIQFIASTHSAIPFLGAPEGSIALKLERDDRGVSQVVWLKDLGMEYLTPDALLSSPLFGLDQLYNLRFKEPPMEMRTEHTYDEVERNREMEALVSRLDAEYQEIKKRNARND